MIVSKTVKKNGIEIPVKQLTKGSHLMVDVKCPRCGEIRSVRYFTIEKYGHCYCMNCVKAMRNRKYIKHGTRFGKLVVIGDSDKSGVSICRCDCGTVREVKNSALKSNGIKSCGCLKADNMRNVKHKKGEDHWNWKGGISGARRREMQSIEYKNWRIAVFERDLYTCQKCGQVGYSLNAHHIYDYNSNKKKRLDIQNGITLCKKCHIKFHSEYGRKNNKKQINEYLNKGAKDEITVSHTA